MNERKIQLAIYWRFNSGILIPNWTPPKWWECDVARIMPSGRWHEYEIKLSKSDFLADRNKLATHGLGRDKHSKIKHLELYAASEKGPNNFWYVMPESVADQVEIPQFAGLILVHEYQNRICINVKKDAPLLHKAKADFAVPERNVFYYRMWGGIEKLVRP